MFTHASRLGRAVRAVMLLALFIVVAIPGAAVADSPFNHGPYGRCAYQYCPDAPQQETVTTPSGLDVSINLVNGQKIAEDEGYTVIITPLNGQGNSFTKVEIYIEGKLVDTIEPDQTGTARWFWDPTRFPGDDIQFIITDDTDRSVTKQYTVVITKKAPSQSQNNGGSGSTANGNDRSSGGGIVTQISNAVQTVLQNVTESGQRIIRALPKPVVYAFPWFLFILLAINIAMLFLQTRRELKAYHALERLRARAQLLDEGKRTFVELLSHYLRTPLTILQGGLDNITAQPGPLAQRLADLRMPLTQLGKKIESLINTIYGEGGNTVVATAALSHQTQLWRQPGLLLPVVLIGVAALSFTYLARNAGGFTITQVNVAAQVIVFGMLVIVSYQVFRRLQLRKRETAYTQQLLAQEAAAAQARDAVVVRAANDFNQEVQALEARITPLPQDDTTKFLHEGMRRFHEIMSKFLTATLIRTDQNNLPPERVEFTALLGRAMTGLQARADAKQVVVHCDTDAVFAVKGVQLLGFVLQSLLDNAITFSPAQGRVEVKVLRQDAQVHMSVTDHGAGINPQRLAELFKPFSKLEGAEVFDHEGAGLSLYLDRLIMTYLAGDIVIDSKPGETVATLVVPDATAELPQPGA